MHDKLRKMNHDVHGVLAVIAGSLEVIRLYPDNAARFVGNLGPQPKRIEEFLKTFASEFEEQLGILKVSSDASNRPKTSF